MGTKSLGTAPLDLRFIFYFRKKESKWGWKCTVRERKILDFIPSAGPDMGWMWGQARCGACCRAESMGLNSGLDLRTLRSRPDRKPTVGGSKDWTTHAPPSREYTSQHHLLARFSFWFHLWEALAWDLEGRNEAEAMPLVTFVCNRLMCRLWKMVNFQWPLVVPLWIILLDARSSSDYRFRLSPVQVCNPLKAMSTGELMPPFFFQLHFCNTSRSFINK